DDGVVQAPSRFEIGPGFLDLPLSARRGPGSLRALGAFSRQLAADLQRIHEALHARQRGRESSLLVRLLAPGCDRPRDAALTHEAYGTRRACPWLGWPRV